MPSQRFAQKFPFSGSVISEAIMTLPPCFNTRQISFSPRTGSGQKYMTADAWHRRIRYCTCPHIFWSLYGCMQRFPPNNRCRPRGFSGSAPECGQDCRHRRTRRPKRFPRPKADKLQTPKGKEVHDLCSLHSLPIYRIYLPVFCNFLRTFLTYSLAPLIAYTRTPAICRERRRNTAFPI